MLLGSNGIETIRRQTAHQHRHFMAELPRQMPWTTSFPLLRAIQPTPGPAVAAMLSGGAGLLAQIVEDYRMHGRDWTRPGFQALAVHRFGNWRMEIQSRLLRAPFSVLYRTLYTGVRNVYGIELPYSARVGRGVVIEHQHGIVVHGKAVIGDGCILRHGVTLGNRSLDRPFEAPRLGANVNVGAGAKILGAVTIGDGAQIGANAVVCCDVPAGAVACGIPARVAGAAARMRKEAS
jgi:serine O-acetyltransferase